MQHQLNTVALPIKMFDTLDFSKNLIKAGMEKTISEELSTNIKNLQITFLENFNFYNDKIELIKIDIINISKEVMALKNEMIIFKTDLRKEMQEFKDEIRKEMQEFKDEIRKEMQEFKDEIRKEMQEFKDEIRKEMQEFKDEIRKEMQEFKDEIRKEMEDFKKEIREEMEDFKKEIREEMKNFRDEIRKEMQELKDNIDLKISKMVTKEEFYNEMQKLSLTMTVRMGFIMSAGIGIIGLLIKF